jgi:hypothetical protein
MDDLDNKGRNPDERGGVDSVEKLPPALLRPPAALHNLLRTHPGLCLRHHRAFPIAIHLQPALLPHLLSICTSAGAGGDDHEAAREGIVVHKHGREGGAEAVDGHSLAEDVEVLDGEAQEALLIQIREVQSVLRRGLAGGHQRRLRQVAAVRYFYRFPHGYIFLTS